MMRCVILQPSYIPWRGYFDLVSRADVFVFYDDVQYDKHGWRNRNRIKTSQGTQWLTIPVLSKSNVTAGIEIRNIRFSDARWAEKHRRTLVQSYGRAPHYDAGLVDRIYGDAGEFLADFTIASTILLAERLGIRNTRFMRSSELGIPPGEDPTRRLLDLLQHLGATHYLSGPAARDYLDDGAFEAAGVELEWIQYDYPEYPQLHPPFDPFVSVLDLLFMTGPDAPSYIWT